jgi:dipeptidyl aminopeptidase/acylaminoacyl peptidase
MTHRLLQIPALVAAIAGSLATIACRASNSATAGNMDASTPAWESVETTSDDGKVVIQKVSYRSGGLRIWGQVCQPAIGGPFPLLVTNHGGASGMGDWNGAYCRGVAQSGVVVIESSYRGEDGSDGAIELCGGEVDDVLAMLDIARTLPEVDAKRVAMWGPSHGGCVTTRAIERGAPVAVAADVFGVVELGTDYAFWRSQLAAGTGPVADYQTLIDLADTAIGGPPEQFPDAYRARSATGHVAELPPELPFIIAQGGADPLVPPIQSCQLAHALGIAGHHFDANHNLIATVPPGCEGTWTQDPAPLGSFAANRYLLVYDTLGHTVDGIVGAALLNDVTMFLLAKLPPA